MIDNNVKVTTKFNNITIIKQVYNFLNLKYDNINIISIEFIEDTLRIYFEGGLFHYYKDVISIQNEVKKFMKENLSKDVENINIVKL